MSKDIRWDWTRARDQGGWTLGSPIRRGPLFSCQSSSCVGVGWGQEKFPPGLWGKAHFMRATAYPYLSSWPGPSQVGGLGFSREAPLKTRRGRDTPPPAPPRQRALSQQQLMSFQALSGRASSLQTLEGCESLLTPGPSEGRQLRGPHLPGGAGALLLLAGGTYHWGSSSLQAWPHSALSPPSSPQLDMQLQREGSSPLMERPDCGLSELLLEHSLIPSSPQNISPPPASQAARSVKSCVL